MNQTRLEERELAASVSEAGLVVTEMESPTPRGIEEADEEEQRRRRR